MVLYSRFRDGGNLLFNPISWMGRLGFDAFFFEAALRAPVTFGLACFLAVAFGPAFFFALAFELAFGAVFLFELAFGAVFLFELAFAGFFGCVFGTGYRLNLSARFNEKLAT